MADDDFENDQLTGRTLRLVRAERKQESIEKRLKRFYAVVAILVAFAVGGYAVSHTLSGKADASVTERVTTLEAILPRLEKKVDWATEQVWRMALHAGIPDVPPPPAKVDAGADRR